MMFEHSLNFSI